MQGFFSVLYGRECMIVHFSLPVQKQDNVPHYMRCSCTSHKALRKAKSRKGFETKMKINKYVFLNFPVFNKRKTGTVFVIQPNSVK